MPQQTPDNPTSSKQPMDGAAMSEALPARVITPPPPPSSSPAETMPEVKTGKRGKGISLSRAPRPGKTKGSHSWLVVAGVVLLVGGSVAGGYLLADPTRSQEYGALAAETSVLQSKLNDSTAEYTKLKGNYDKLSTGVYQREKTVGEREAQVEKAEAALKERETAVTGAEQLKAANTVGDGTWTVGTTVAPGTYISAAEVGSSCYWGIYRSGSNGSDIIDNDLPGGGRPTVTLSEGQDFKSSRCGNWEKQ